MLSYQRAKNIEDALGPQQAEPIIAALQELDRKIDDQRTALKADLLVEIATKADIANLRTEIKTDIAQLNGKIDTEIAKITGELKSIRLWMKLLVAIGILGISLFSPAAVKLLEMLK